MARADAGLDSFKPEAQSQRVGVDGRPERGQVVTASCFSSDERQAKGHRLMCMLQARLLHRQPGDAGWPIANIGLGRLHRPAHRKASNPRSLLVLRADQAGLLRRPRKAKHPRSLSELLRLAAVPRPAAEADTPRAAEEVALPWAGEDVDWHSDGEPATHTPPDVITTERTPSLDVSQFKGETARKSGLADGTGEPDGSEGDLEVLCCQCGVILDTAEGETIRPAIGDCDAPGCGHWACVPCSGVAEGYEGRWTCGCSGCGMPPHRSSSPGGSNHEASPVFSPVIPLPMPPHDKKWPQAAQSPGRPPPPSAARALSCDTSGARRDPASRPFPVGDATLATSSMSATGEGESDSDEPGDFIPLSERKRQLAPKTHTGPTKPKAGANGAAASAALSAGNKRSGAPMTDAEAGSQLQRKVPRVRFKLNGKGEKGEGRRSAALHPAGKREGAAGDGKRGAREGLIGAAAASNGVGTLLADAPAAAPSSAGGGDLEGAPFGDSAGWSSDLDSPREGTGDVSRGTLLTREEASGACARSVGARLIERYRRRKARSSEARKLTMHSMVAPTWLDPAASEVVGSSTVASRGSRREHRQLVRACEGAR
jgi:hypothetical protein